MLAMRAQVSEGLNSVETLNDTVLNSVSFFVSEELNSVETFQSLQYPLSSLLGFRRT